MAVHESQSLFVEKQLGRNPAFWQWALPVVETHFGEPWSIDDILPHVHHVERGLIRVDADEVTYPLHVILRFELEQDLVAGRLSVSNLPEAWDAKMRDYLSLRPSTMRPTGRCRTCTGRAPPWAISRPTRWAP
jgi:carboxypeptidase Taq